MPSKRVIFHIFFWPIFIVVLVFIGLSCLEETETISVFSGKSVEIGSAVISIGITMLGLLIASLAILASIPENSLLKN